MLQLPLDISTLTTEELRERQLRRKPKKKLVVEDRSVEQKFDHKKYRHLIRR